MFKIGTFAFALLASTLFFSNAASAFSVTYTQKVSVDGEQIAEIKVWTKDELVKTESEFQGMKMQMIRNTEGVFSYFSAQNTATKLPKDMDRPNLTTEIPKYKAFLEKNNAKKSGEETVDGKTCDIFIYTDPMLKREAKAWVWREKDFPVQIEVDAAEGKTLIQIQDIKFDVAIQDTEFQLPAGAKIMDMNQMQAPPALPQEESAIAAE